MRLDQYLADSWDSGREYGSPELQRVLDGKPDTTTAARMWTEIADGSASVEDTLEWAQHVAAKIVKYVVKGTERDAAPGTERDAAPAALRAIGFRGRVDVYRAARECLESLASFDVIDEHGESRPSARRPASEWLKLLRSHGELLDVRDKTAINMINTLRKDLGIE